MRCNGRMRLGSAQRLQSSICRKERESLEHAQVSSVRSTVGIHSIRPLLTWLPKRPRDLPDKAGLRLHQEHGPISSEWAKFSPINGRIPAIVLYRMKSFDIIESKDAQRGLQCSRLDNRQVFFFQTVDNCIQFRCKMQGGVLC